MLSHGVLPRVQMQVLLLLQVLVLLHHYLLHPFWKNWQTVASVEIVSHRSTLFVLHNFSCGHKLYRFSFNH